MATLAVNFAGLELKNPFIVASSELTDKIDKIKWAEDAGASAVSTKLCFLEVPFFARPYHVYEKRGAFYSPSGNRLDIDQAQELIRQCKEQTDLKIIANMMGPGDNVDGWVKLAQMLEEAGADMVELNMSCPNVGLMSSKTGMDKTAEMGAALGKLPKLAGQVCGVIAEGINIPVMAKMTPEGDTDIVADECFKGGAAAVSAINCPMSLPPCDIYNGGKPVYPSSGNQSFAGLCGEWIRPLAFRHIAGIRQRNPKVPIAGGGGLMTWEESVQMLMYGSNVLTYVSVLYRDGFKVLPRFAKKILNFMEENGYETVTDMMGLALRHIVTPQKVDYIDKIPQVNDDKCTGCGVCADLGHCEVIEFDQEEKLPKIVHPEKCYYCGYCYFRCPAGAIDMVPVKS